MDDPFEPDLTDSRKHHIGVCLSCDVLFMAKRRDQLTCSPACRVKAHRTGKLKSIRQIARAYHIPPAMMVWAKAVKRLRHDLSAKLPDGRTTLEVVRPEVVREFHQMVWAEVEREP